MMTSLRIPAARAALALALAAAAPARAQPAPPVAAARQDRDGCSQMMAFWQSAQARYSAMGRADLDAYNTVQNEIDRAAHFCEAGQGAEVRRIMDDSKRPAGAPAVGVSLPVSP